MACNKCSGGGPFLCQKCVRALAYGIVEDEQRASGKLGFKIVPEGGVGVLEFLIERCTTAVNLLHARAGEATDVQRASDARKAADDLFEAVKIAKEAIRSGQGTPH